MGNIKEIIKSFSFTPMIRTNISAAPALPGVSRSASNRSSIAEPTALLSNRMLSTYYLRLQELGNYEMTELTDSIIGLFTDYIISYIKDDYSKIISISDDVENNTVAEERINKVLDDLQLVQDIKLHLWEYIYYGSYSYSLEWDSHNKCYTKRLLVNPNNVVRSYSNDTIKSYLIQSNQDNLHEVDPCSVVMIGNPTIELFDDMSEKAKKQDLSTKKTETLYKSRQFRGCKPLFYSIIGKVKEFLIKDQLINLLSIKDLITPLVFCVAYEKQTPPL